MVSQKKVFKFSFCVQYLVKVCLLNPFYSGKSILSSISITVHSCAKDLYQIRQEGKWTDDQKGCLRGLLCQTQKMGSTLKVQHQHAKQKFSNANKNIIKETFVFENVVTANTQNNIKSKISTKNYFKQKIRKNYIVSV